jgi:hypothetical protein
VVPVSFTIPDPSGFGPEFSLYRQFLRMSNPSLVKLAPFLISRLLRDTDEVPGKTLSFVPLEITLPAKAVETPIQHGKSMVKIVEAERARLKRINIFFIGFLIFFSDVKIQCIVYQGNGALTYNAIVKNRNCFFGRKI